MTLTDLEIDGRQRQMLMQAPKNCVFYVLNRSDVELISAEKYVHVNSASHIDLESGRPVLTGLTDYSEQARYVFPSAPGDHNWQLTSYSPGIGLVHIPDRDAGWVPNQAGEKWFELGVDYLGELAEGQDIPPSRGYLNASNPVTQKLTWQQETANIWNGGALATAGGVVFHGTATGRFYALNDQTGEVLLELPVGTGMIAPR